MHEYTNDLLTFLSEFLGEVITPTLFERIGQGIHEYNAIGVAEGRLVRVPNIMLSVNDVVDTHIEIHPHGVKSILMAYTNSNLSVKFDNEISDVMMSMADSEWDTIQNIQARTRLCKVIDGDDYDT